MPCMYLALHEPESIISMITMISVFVGLVFHVQNDLRTPTQGSLQVSKAAGSCSVVQQRHSQLQCGNMYKRVKGPGSTDASWSRMNMFALMQHKCCREAAISASQSVFEIYRTA